MKIEVQYSAWSAHSLSVQVVSKIFDFFYFSQGIDVLLSP